MNDCIRSSIPVDDGRCKAPARGPIGRTLGATDDNITEAINVAEMILSNLVGNHDKRDVNFAEPGCMVEACELSMAKSKMLLDKLNQIHQELWG